MVGEEAGTPLDGAWVGISVCETIVLGAGVLEGSGGTFDSVGNSLRTIEG